MATTPSSGLRTATFLGGGAPFGYDYGSVPLGDVAFGAGSDEVSLELRDAGRMAYRYASSATDRPADPVPELAAFGHRLSRVTTPGGDATEQLFDGQGRIREVHHADATTETFEYGLDGRLDRRVLGDGTELDYVIDTAGRELSRTSSTGHSRSFTYGPGDRIETATGPTGTVTLSYDAAGRLERTASPVGAVEYGYDLANRVERVTVEVGRGVRDELRARRRRRDHPDGRPARRRDDVRERPRRPAREPDAPERRRHAMDV